MENTVEIPAKFKSIVEAIETMSVLDLNELVKLFEKKFGVSAAATAVSATAASVPATSPRGSLAAFPWSSRCRPLVSIPHQRF